MLKVSKIKVRSNKIACQPQDTMSGLKRKKWFNFDSFPISILIYLGTLIDD